MGQTPKINQSLQKIILIIIPAQILIILISVLIIFYLEMGTFLLPNALFAAPWILTLLIIITSNKIMYLVSSTLLIFFFVVNSISLYMLVSYLTTI